MEIKTPWYSSYGPVPRHLEYPDVSMIRHLETRARAWPDIPAYNFLGRHASYNEFIRDIHQCAKALRAIGI